MTADQLSCSSSSRFTLVLVRVAALVMIAPIVRHRRACRPRVRALLALALAVLVVPLELEQVDRACPTRWSTTWCWSAPKR